MLDEYGEVQPAVDSFSGAGQSSAQVSRTIQLEAARRGDDRDGRLYTIEAVVQDRACNVTILRTSVVIQHDRR